MTSACMACNRPVLIVRTGKNQVVALDITSRKHIYELGDASIELVASKVDAQETYIDHACVCDSPTKAGDK